MMFKSKLGIAQIPVLIGLLIMAIALPVASTLVKQTQDTRGEAATDDGKLICERCSKNNGCEWVVYKVDKSVGCNVQYESQMEIIERKTKCECGQVVGGNNTRCQSSIGVGCMRSGNCDIISGTCCVNSFNSPNLVYCEKDLVCDQNSSSATWNRCIKPWGSTKICNRCSKDKDCYKVSFEAPGDKDCNTTEPLSTSLLTYTYDSSCCANGATTKWYFCLKQTGTPDVVAVDSGKMTETECLKYAKEYIANGFVEYNRGNVGDFCLPESEKSQCTNKIKYMYYCDESSGCKMTSERHFSKDSCEKKASLYNPTAAVCYDTENACKEKCGTQKWYYCDGTQSTCKVDTNAYVDSASCSRANGGRTCYYYDEQTYCNNLCVSAGYKYVCGTNGCEKTSQKFATESECTNILGKVCYSSSTCNGVCGTTNKPCSGSEATIGHGSWGCQSLAYYGQCNNGVWTNVQYCQYDCKNGKCNPAPKTTCTDYLGKEITSGYWGCKSSSVRSWCDVGNWKNDEACTNGCENGVCKTVAKTTCTDYLGKEIVSRDWGCVLAKRKAYCADGNWTSFADCPNGCENGICKDSVNPLQCTTYDGIKINSGAFGCSTHQHLNKCNNGYWSSNAGEVSLCTGSKKCINNQCVDVFCPGAEGNVAAGSSGCRTSSARAICMVNASGNAVWGADIPCASGVCKNGACEGEALKCSKCANNMDRAKGDADCDGKITLNDWAIWLKEFETGKGTEVRTNWLADFDCDGKVTGDELGDLNIWFSSYLEYQSK